MMIEFASKPVEPHGIEDDRDAKPPEALRIKTIVQSVQPVFLPPLHHSPSPDEDEVMGFIDPIHHFRRQRPRLPLELPFQHVVLGGLDRDVQILAQRGSYPGHEGTVTDIVRESRCVIHPENIRLHVARILSPPLKRPNKNVRSALRNRKVK